MPSASEILVVVSAIAVTWPASFLGRPRPRFGCSLALDPLSLGLVVVDGATVVGPASATEEVCPVCAALCVGVGATGAMAVSSEPKVIFVPRSSATISACASVTVSHVSLISIVIRPFLS
jgi:hypothetical protein